MFACTSKTEINLYNKKFFILSCLSNIMSHVFTIIITPHLFWVGTLFSLIISVMLVDNIVRVHSDAIYRQYYSIKMIIGMIMITCSVFSINKEYVIYLPILMGIMYLNVNALIKSKWVENIVLLFMGAPFIKVAMYDSTRKFEYFAVLVVFIILAYMSNTLFHSTKQKLDEYEHRANSIKEIHGLMHYLTCHEVRNELTKMTCLQQIKYRNNVELFQDTLYGYINNINQLVNSQVLDNHEEIKLHEIIDELNHITSKNTADFHYDTKVPTLLYSNRSFLLSTIKRFIEISIERAKIHPTRKYIKISQHKNIISIEDNCGKVDILNSKTPNNSFHCIFVRTVTDPTINNLFNFSASINETSDGLKVDLIFSEH